MRRLGHLCKLGLVGVLACDADDGGASPPDAPTELTVAAAGSGAHLTWIDASDDEDEFVIERRGADDFTEVDRVPVDAVQFHDEGAGPGAWVYRVGARNDAGVSWSDEVAVTLQ